MKCSAGIALRRSGRLSLCDPPQAKNPASRILFLAAVTERHCLSRRASSSANGGESAHGDSQETQRDSRQKRRYRILVDCDQCLGWNRGRQFIQISDIPGRREKLTMDSGWLAWMDARLLLPPLFSPTFIAFPSRLCYHEQRISGASAPCQEEYDHAAF